MAGLAAISKAIAAGAAGTNRRQPWNNSLFNIKYMV